MSKIRGLTRAQLHERFHWFNPLDIDGELTSLVVRGIVGERTGVYFLTPHGLAVSDRLRYAEVS